MMPFAHVGWFSPICTEASPAGGNSSWSAQGEFDLFNDGRIKKNPGMERTRATFWEVIRATELWGYEAVIVENVADVATRWLLFDHWVEAMKILGYEVQFVSVSSAHIGAEENPWAPQWRDRLYMVFTKISAPLPDVEPRPLARCFTCDEDVNAVQSWKRPGRRIGKYRQHYHYVCPNAACRHQQVEPYVLPADSIIDWSNLGQRIGDKKPQRRYGGLPLAPNTLARIEIGLEMFGEPDDAAGAGISYQRPVGVSAPPAGAGPGMVGSAATRGCPAFVDVAHTHRKPRPAGERLAALNVGRDHALVTPSPDGPRVARATDALVCPPLLVEHRRNGEARPVTAEPTSTITAGGNHHSLIVPPAFYVKNYGGNANARDLVRPVSLPFGSITTRDSTSLVIPFRRGARPHRPSEPIGTVATRAQHGLLGRIGISVMDCMFRMLTAAEHLAAQRFHPSYVVLGTEEQRTMQAGNAVSANVAQWLGAAVAAALCGQDERAA